jgi:hypothetical protein
VCGIRDGRAAVRTIVYRRQQALHTCRIFSTWHHRRVVDNSSAIAVARKLKVGLLVTPKKVEIYSGRAVTSKPVELLYVEED